VYTSARKLLGSSLLLTGLSLLLAACSDTTTPNDPDALTKAEAQSLAEQLGSQALSVGAASGAQTSFDYNVTNPCVLGGTVQLSGHIDAQNDTATDVTVLDIVGHAVYQDCAVVASGTHMTLTGDPSLTASAHLTTQGGRPQGLQSAAVTGGLLYVTEDDRTGHCPVDFQAALDGGTLVQTLQGQFCGFSVDTTTGG
jgi:hypothetical protein